MYSLSLIMFSLDCQLALVPFSFLLYLYGPSSLPSLRSLSISLSSEFSQLYSSQFTQRVLVRIVVDRCKIAAMLSTGFLEL
jgi:hypothetical protein